VLVLTVQPSNRLTAQLYRPDERVVISDFSNITAVAASPWMVFAATPNGLVIYDRGQRRWRTPVTLADGYPLATVRVALADQVGNAVWLGGDDGVSRYDVDANTWDHAGVPGGVRGLMLDSQDGGTGIFVLGAQGWGFLSRGGAFPVPGQPLPPPNRRIQPLDARSALALAPVADASRAMLLTDQRLRSYQFTAAARTPDQGDLFFGTNGMGVLRYDAATNESEHLLFGLANPRADVVVAGPGGVWTVGSARAGERRAVTWVPDDLSETDNNEDALGRNTAVLFARRLLSAQAAVWVATDHGVFRSPEHDGTGRLFDIASGLPSEDVRALAPAPDGVWAGTARGLAVITNDGNIVRLGTVDRAVLSLVAQRESLWVGTADGLGLLEPGANAPAVTPELASVAELRQPIVALTHERDTIIAATPVNLAWRNPATAAWTVLRARADVGTVNTLAGDAGGAWIGGTTGLAYWNIARGTFKVLHVPLDVPAVVRDVTVEGKWLWVATDAGLVRFDRDAVLRR
jgi:ligand-binding sensor domain-containing protein